MKYKTSTLNFIKQTFKVKSISNTTEKSLNVFKDNYDTHINLIMESNLLHIILLKKLLELYTIWITS